MKRPGQLAQPGDRFLTAAEAGAAKLTRLHVDRRRVRRAGMDIQARECHRYGHGRTLLPLHGVSRSQSPARQTPELQPEDPAFKRSRLLSRHRV